MMFSADLWAGEYSPVKPSPSKSLRQTDFYFQNQFQCGVEKWSSRLAHNQWIVGSNPTCRNYLEPTICACDKAPNYDESMPDRACQQTRAFSAAYSRR